MQNFDPLKPSKHLDIDEIIKQNYIFLDNATNLVQTTDKKIIELNQKFYTTSEKEQEKLQIEIDKLYLQLHEYKDHQQYCLDSLDHATSLKLDLDQ